MSRKVRVLVRVLPIDIRYGWRDSCEGCALSLALHRALGYPVYVSGENIVKADGDPREGGRVIADLPSRARRFVADFDAGRKVAGFGFYLRVGRRDITSD